MATQSNNYLEYYTEFKLKALSFEKEKIIWKPANLPDWPQEIISPYQFW